MKRPIALILLVCLLFGCVACHPADPVQPSESETEQSKPSIYSVDLSSYRLVVAEDSSDDVQDKATALKTAFETVLGIKMECVTDFQNEQLGTMEQACEILIGNADREALQQYQSSRLLDYYIDKIGDKIVIYGGSDEAVVNAISYFIETEVVQGKASNSFSFSTYAYRHSYPLEALLINGVDVLKEYSVLDETKNGLESVFIERIAQESGVVMARGTQGSLVIFRETDALAEDQYRVSVQNGQLVFEKGKHSVFCDLTNVLEIFMQENQNQTTRDITNLNLQGQMDTKFLYYTQAVQEKLEEERNELYQAIQNTPNPSVSNRTGTVYYVSASDGNDQSAGTTPQTAWKSLSRVNSAKLRSGDSVLFKRGDEWRTGKEGTLICVDGVLYSSYGEGEKPLFNGSPCDGVLEGSWMLTDAPNVYRYSKNFSNDVGGVVMNDGECFAQRIVCAYKEGKVHWDTLNSRSFKGYSDLKEDMTYWYDAYDECVYLCSTEGNPAQRFQSIEFLINQKVIFATSNTVLDNLAVRYTGSHAIQAHTCKNFTVRNCDIQWIGGSVQYYHDSPGKQYSDPLTLGAGVLYPVRYGNAIEIYGECDGYYVEYCYINQIYDAGVTWQVSGTATNRWVQREVEISHCLIERCAYSIEYFLHNENTETEMYGISIHDNMLLYAGVGLGGKRPTNNAAAHLKTWRICNNLISDFTLKNNVIAFGETYMLDAGSLQKDAEQIKFQGNRFYQYADEKFGFCGYYPATYQPYDAAVIDAFAGNVFYIYQR